MKFIIVVLCLFNVNETFAQEAMINDIKRCDRLYWIQGDLIKQIRKEKDTINYFHDEELVIFYNREKTKRLSANTFYVVNHGFNKLITMNVLHIMVEFTDSKRNKDTLISNPNQYIKVFHEDSLQRGTYATVAFNIENSQYKKWMIKSYFIEIKYYQKTIYRWFLKESELGNLFPIRKNFIETI
jgi:hypothetical protein